MQYPLSNILYISLLYIIIWSKYFSFRYAETLYASEQGFESVCIYVCVRAYLRIYQSKHVDICVSAYVRI